MHLCDYCRRDGIRSVLRICRECEPIHWFCDECSKEMPLTVVELAALTNEQSKVLIPKGLKEELVPQTKWHKLILIVPQGEGEANPKEWDWQDLIGCIDSVKIESCEPTTAPEAK